MKQRGGTTSVDVARRAGVSQSAVSRVFTPGASVSSGMRARVLEAAEELGYRPNVIARSLITGKSRIIGLVASYIDNLYYPIVLEKLSGALQSRGYHLLMFMAGRSDNADGGAEETVDAVVEEILGYQVDGIVMASVAMSSTLADRIAVAGLPVLLFNRTSSGDGFSTVTSDNAAGGRALADFLVAGGHSRIAHIAGWEGASTQRDRERGFCEGLAAAGLELYAREVGDFDYAGARAATRRMFGAANPPPDALFVANDHMALAAMDVLRFDLGLSIPDDVSVVSYDDVPQAAWDSYRLTTIRQPTDAMVSAIVDGLLDQIDRAGCPPRQQSFAGDLIVRASAKVPKETT